VKIWCIEYGTDDSEGTGEERVWMTTKAEAERMAKEIDKQMTDSGDGRYAGVAIVSVSVPALKREIVQFLNKYADKA
jgi:hypothetical protein